MKKKIEVASSSNLPLGSLVAIAAGGVLLYANRFRIQRLLESVGIKTPWMTGSLADAFHSGVAKISGEVDAATSEPVNHA